jgi:LmbE family N-acetylglucosaminyl deacetylase
MTNLPTLVCVHAHPDDEAVFTSGISSHYSALGHRVVLVTCTNGALGLDDKGRPGSDPDHDADVTQSTRAGELARAARHAGFTRAITLGYEDSGMVGWPQNESPSAFTNVDVDVVATTLAALFDEVDAKVVVTYDENGFYGHPDHIMANRVTQRAVTMSADVERLYYPVVPAGVVEKFKHDAKEQGLSMPAFVLEAIPLTPDDRVAAVMDVRAYATRKQECIAMHSSQVDNDDIVTMAPDLFAMLFGTEYYQRAWSRNPVVGDETDLFGGF